MAVASFTLRLHRSARRPSLTRVPYHVSMRTAAGQRGLGQLIQQRDPVDVIVSRSVKNIAKELPSGRKVLYHQPDGERVKGATLLHRGTNLRYKGRVGRRRVESRRNEPARFRGNRGSDPQQHRSLPLLWRENRNSRLRAPGTRQPQPRVGRNPKTGARVDVPAKRIPYFKARKELKDLGLNPRGLFFQPFRWFDSQEGHAAQEIRTRIVH